MKKLLITLAAVAAFTATAFCDLASDYALISNTGFKGRVTMAVLKAARDIRVESSGIANHAERLAWADSIINLGEADRQAGLFLPNVVANATISAAGTNATDNDVIFVVNSLVDQYALSQFPQEEE